MSLSPRIGSSITLFNNRIWIVGGATNIDKPAYLNEALASNDGINWSSMPVNTDFTGREGHQITSFNDTIMVSGGENSNNSYNEVWSIK